MYVLLNQLVILLISVWSSSNYILLINGGGGSGREVADVADIMNPTSNCQSSPIASFPSASSGNWHAKGGWVDGVLIICSRNNDKKCFSLSQDGKLYITMQSETSFEFPAEQNSDLKEYKSLLSSFEALSLLSLRHLNSVKVSRNAKIVRSFFSAEN